MSKIRSSKFSPLREEASSGEKILNGVLVALVAVTAIFLATFVIR